MTDRCTTSFSIAALPMVARSMAALSLVVLTSMPNAASADRLLQRQRPLVVRWGEVEVAETTLVRVAPIPGETAPPGSSGGAEAAGPGVTVDDVTYPNAIRLVFKGRLREEEMRDLLDGTSRARSRATLAGTLYVAGRMEGGRRTWDGFTKKLQEAAARLTPAGYDGFLSDAATVLSVAACDDFLGEFEITFCVDRAGEPGPAGETHRRSKETGSKTYLKGADFCGSLRDAFQGQPPVEILTTGFVVDESLEESLDLVRERRLEQPPVALPEGARTSRKDPPERMSTTSSGTSGDGVAHGEMFRRDGGGSGQGGGRAYILTVDIRDAALARDLPHGRSVLARWDVTLRDTRLGAPPHSAAEERQSLLMGVFCTSLDCTPDLDAFTGATTAKLSASQGLLGAQQVRSAMDISTLPAESFTVLCVPGPGRVMNATYCLSNVCVNVLNPGPVCDDIAGALPG